MSQSLVCVHIPATIAVGSLRVDDDKALLISKILELGPGIESVGIAMTPVKSNDKSRFGGEILWDIDPRADTRRIRAKVGNLGVCRPRDVVGPSRCCRARSGCRL